jgi:AcrR family transcriptional regulator
MVPGLEIEPHRRLVEQEERGIVGDLRRALLDAARAILRESGVPALSLRGVARRAGVSHMAPYHHFAGRAELVAAVAADGFHRLTAEMRARMESGGADPVERLRACGIAYVVFAAENPELFRLMFGRELADSSAHPDLQQAAREAYSTFAAGLPAPSSDEPEEGEAADGPGPERRDPLPPTGLAAWSLVHGLATLLADGQVGGGSPSAEEAEQLTRKAMGALRRVGQAPGS